MNNNRYCIIMAGGVGSRFWPISRRSTPKQFLDILGTGKSFIRHTYERFARIIPPENFLVVTNNSYKEQVLRHIPEIGERQVLGEPVGRNTAPCIAYAAWRLKTVNPDATMIVTPADHLILNEDEFRRAIVEAAEFAENRRAMMTIGIRPNRPDTGYGYIQVDNRSETDGSPIFKVKTFTEKPNLELARTFVESGEFFLEFGHFHLEDRNDPRKFQRLSARPATDVRVNRGLLQYPAGTAAHRTHLPRMPQRFDRLRRDGKGARRLRPLQRLRMVGHRNVGIAVPAFAQRRERERGKPLLYAVRHGRMHRQNGHG